MVRRGALVGMAGGVLLFGALAALAPVVDAPPPPCHRHRPATQGPATTSALPPPPPAARRRRRGAAEAWFGLVLAAVVVGLGLARPAG
ncbi:hypothetical protein ACH4OY_00035 [Micromonospora rubida]|uniref:Uncharacterized protein n=1 Tax=Micromonospora rubida TaxID=2697657 RepID=A0ABW7SBN6_9ACTN